ncbi:MAG TPA: hypothetical protein VFR18_01200, partial [Terriglobia bacterium]|nr:hypothetical protein [Terriglobia bacterium]
MDLRSYWTGKTVAIVTAWTMVVPPLAPALLGSPFAQTTPAQTAAQPAPTDAEVDGGWPRDYVTPSEASVVLYQPQVASWDKQTELVLYAAV